jgi:hypothetical protein
MDASTEIRLGTRAPPALTTSSMRCAEQDEREAMSPSE